MAQADRNIPVAREQPQSRQSRGASFDRWHPLTSLRRQISHLLEDLDRISPFRPISRSGFDLVTEPVTRSAAETIMMPLVDIVEQDQAILLTAELPGMDENDIELKLSNGNLTLKGEKKNEREESSKGYYLSECSYGSFQRNFALPDTIDADKIEASFDKGVLTITLPKRPEKVIDIKPPIH